jgi:hypothetical protein
VCVESRDFAERDDGDSPLAHWETPSVTLGQEDPYWLPSPLEVTGLP